MMGSPVLTRLLLLLFLLPFPGSAAVAAEQPGPYLYDLMKQEAYVTAWKTMLGPDMVPDWVKTYADTLDGPAAPSITVPVGGDSYTLGFTCKAHDCGGNQLYVLFAPGAKQAWGLLITGESHRWLGHPEPPIQQAILSRVE
jgi:Inhibitor of vertebrate lysozyme (Ivy)